MSGPVEREEAVTAIVVLRSASGERITGRTPITVATLERYAPDPNVVRRVARSFRDAGFRVGPSSGISFAVTAPIERFEDFFGATVSQAADGGWVATRGTGGTRATRELPVSALPKDLAARVSAVTFDEPAELVGP